MSLFGRKVPPATEALLTEADQLLDRLSDLVAEVRESIETAEGEESE